MLFANRTMQRREAIGVRGIYQFRRLLKQRVYARDISRNGGIVNGVCIHSVLGYSD